MDDRLLGRTREEGGTRDLGDLQPGQLAELRAERAASRRPAALGIVSRAVRPPLRATA